MSNDIGLIQSQRYAKVEEKTIEWQVRFWRVCVGYGIPEALVAFQELQQLFQMKRVTLPSASSKIKMKSSVLTCLTALTSKLVATEIFLLCESGVTVLTCLLEECVMKLSYCEVNPEEVML